MPPKSTLVNDKITITKTIRIAKSDAQFVEKFSKENGNSMSWIYQQAIRLFREKYIPGSFK
jgi:hypothetical protein